MPCHVMSCLSASSMEIKWSLTNSLTCLSCTVQREWFSSWWLTCLSIRKVCDLLCLQLACAQPVSSGCGYMQQRMGLRLSLGWHCAGYYSVQQFYNIQQTSVRKWAQMKLIELKNSLKDCSIGSVWNTSAVHNRTGFAKNNPGSLLMSGENGKCYYIVDFGDSNATINTTIPVDRCQYVM